MDILNIIISIFAFIGLLTITIIMLYYIARAIRNYTPPEPPLFPDPEYMEKIGTVCPTGWVHQGKTLSGEDICQNTYKVPIENKEGCYDDYNNFLKYFDPITDWEKCQNDPGNCKPLRQRCNWIKKCGPSPETIDPTTGKVIGENPYASWIGVRGYC